MKVHRYLIFLLITQSLVYSGQVGGSRQNDFFEFIRQQLNNGKIFSARDAELSTIDKILKPEELDSIEDYSGGNEFGEIVRDNEYALLHDVDGDSVKELLLMQRAGSMPSYWLVLCGFDTATKKFRVIKTFDDHNLVPQIYHDHLYFVENRVNPQSKYIKEVGVFDISGTMELIELTSLKAHYSYHLDNYAKQFIRTEFLESLRERSFGHLRDTSFYSLDENNQTVTMKNLDSIRYHVFYTTNGLPSALGVDIRTRNGHWVDVEQILKSDFVCGFDLIERGHEPYIIVASEKECPGCINIDVISVDSLKLYRAFNVAYSLSFE